MINPKVVEGQIAGGVVQGIGGALYEHMVYDDRGTPVTTSFADYLLPTAAEVPDIEYGHVVTPATTNPGGHKGMGEGGAIGAPAAVLNAVADALAHVGRVCPASRRRRRSPTCSRPPAADRRGGHGRRHAERRLERLELIELAKVGHGALREGVRRARTSTTLRAERVHERRRAAHCPGGEHRGHRRRHRLLRRRLRRRARARVATSSPTRSPRSTATDRSTVDSYFFFVSADARSVIGWGAYRDVVVVGDDGARISDKTIVIDVHTDLDAGWAMPPLPEGRRERRAARRAGAPSSRAEPAASARRPCAASSSRGRRGS